MRMAKDRGVRIDDAVLAAVEEKTWKSGGARIAKAAEWLKANKPVSTEDASFRLMGLAWAHGDMDGARRDLLAMQRADGGWGQLTGYVSDAYSTGEAVFALRESGVEA